MMIFCIQNLTLTSCCSSKHFNSHYSMLETEGGDCDHISHLGKFGQLVALLNWLMEIHHYDVVIL